MTDVESQVRRSIGVYRSAVLAKDVEAFMQIYDPDVRIFDTWGEWSQEGAARWQVSIEGWFSSLRDERCRVAFEDVRIIEGGAMAAMSAMVRYEAISAQGESMRSMDNRLSWVLQMRRNVWRVIHEHTSVPVGFDDAKAILKRKAGG